MCDAWSYPSWVRPAVSSLCGIRTQSFATGLNISVDTCSWMSVSSAIFGDIASVPAPSISATLPFYRPPGLPIPLEFNFSF
jgi:hypothetical protein